MTQKELKKIISSIVEESILDVEYEEFISWSTSSVVEEGLLSDIGDFVKSIPAKFKDAVEFVKNLAETLKANISDIFELIKSKPVFGFFKALKWSVHTLFDAITALMSKWTKIRQKIVDKLVELKPLEHIKSNWNSFCKWADETIFKPLGKLGSLILAGLMTIVWLNMSFTGDVKYDFDNSHIINGVKGNLSFTDCFHDDFDLIILLVLGVTGNALFAWGPGATYSALSAARLGASLIYSALLVHKDDPMVKKFREIFKKDDLSLPKPFDMSKMSNSEISKALASA